MISSTETITSMESDATTSNTPAANAVVAPPTETVVGPGADADDMPQSLHAQPPLGDATKLPDQATSQAEEKSSPSKPGPNKSTRPALDLQASLASISARLTPYITPAELEIARINHGHAAKRSGRGQMSNGEQRMVDEEAIGDDYGDDGNADNVCTLSSFSQSPGKHNSATRKSGNTMPHTIGGHTVGMRSALQESMMAEEWVNMHLEVSGDNLIPAPKMPAIIDQLFPWDDDALSEEEALAYRKSGEDAPLARAGIDRWTLYRIGMPKDLVCRLYRALYVYTNGFHNVINEIASHCPPSVEKHVSANIWVTFLLLLEQCENGKYKMAMGKFKQATEEWRERTLTEFTNEKQQLQAQVRALETQLVNEATLSEEKSTLIATLASDATTTNAAIANLHREIADRDESLRLMRLEILVREDQEKQLNGQLDDARKDYEIANSERFNAVTERYALDEELRKMQEEFTRLESEKTNYAKRMHETLFMNQALRSTNETLKQKTVVLKRENEKVEKDKQSALENVKTLEGELQELRVCKVELENELVSSTRRHDHVEERLKAIKQQLDEELEANALHVKEVASLTAQIDEGKVQVGVLEAKCNLMSEEKQNTGMRAQDKLRIERLINQKLDLEHQVEDLKLERTKDQEKIWNQRASLEALDSELQHSKRVFSAGQQAFLHSERIAEQLRNQLQESEKNYAKSSKSLTSLRERFKMFEETSKSQVSKLEVEITVATAQIREITYVNRENATTIAQLTKTIDVADKETKALKLRLVASEKDCEELRTEKEEIQRDQKQRDQQRSTSQQSILRFISDLHELLAVVKADEFPLDDGLREILRMVKETFGDELSLDKILNEDEELEDVEEEYDEDELAEEENERRRLMRRRPGITSEVGDIEDTGQVEKDGDSGQVLKGDDNENQDKRRQTKVARVSKWRRSKLDTQVRKLQRDLVNKAELISSLENVICSQADEIAMLTTTNEKHLRWQRLNENRSGMICADLEGTVATVSSLRFATKKLELALKESKIEFVMESNKTFQLEVQLIGLQRQFDMQCIQYEDLLGRIGRAYEYDLYMRSLRREEAIQATEIMADNFTQTLVPQRNPALERVRIPALNLPSLQPGSTISDKSFLSQITDRTNALLPGVSKSIGLQSTSISPSEMENRDRFGPYAATRPRQSANSSSSNRAGRHQRAHRQGGSVDRSTPSRNSSPSHIVRHVNEFGVRQDVLVSPVYPPYFPARDVTTTTREGAVKQSMGSRPLVTVSSGSTIRKDRKPGAVHHQNLQFSGGNNPSTPIWQESLAVERTDSTWNSSREGPRRTHIGNRDDPRMTSKTEEPGSGGLRYHRGFLRTGMEVLRKGGSRRCMGEKAGEPHESDDESGDDSDDLNGFGYEIDDYDADVKVDGLVPASWSIQWGSPSKLETAVRGYQREMVEQAAQAPLPSRYYAHRLKDDDVRGCESLDADEHQRDDVHGSDDEDGDEFTRTGQSSRFVPGVLYPILPPQ